MKATARILLLLLQLHLLFVLPNFGKKIVRTVVGTPLFGGDGKLAVHATMNEPNGVFFDEKSNQLYIADSANHVIRKVDRNGVMATIAGTPGISGYSGDGNLSTTAKFNYPTHVFVTNTGDVLVADTFNSAIRFINSTSGIITTIGQNEQGSIKEIASPVPLNSPRCVMSHKSEIYICDSSNHVIRKMLENGTMVIIAGRISSEGYSGDNDLAIYAQLNDPYSIAMTANDELLIADYGNHVIRKVFLNGTIITFAGKGIPPGGYSGDGGLAMDADLKSPFAVAVSPLSNDTFIVDTNSVIRRVFSSNQTIITVAGVGDTGYTGDDQPATVASLNLPADLFISSQEEIYIADTFNNVVRKITPTQTMQTIAGYNPKSDKATLQQKLSSLSSPTGFYFNKNRTKLWIAETVGNVIKQIDLQTNEISIIAGQLFQYGYNPQHQMIPAVNATLFYPYTVVMDEETQELYISDSGSNFIRKIFANGTISYFAGNKQFLQEGSLATEITLNNPTGLYLHNNILYIADTQNAVIRRVFLNNSTTNIVAGGYKQHGYLGDGGSAIYAKLRSPECVFVTPSNQILICDSLNHAIRKVFRNGTIITLAGGTNPLYQLNDLFHPTSISVNIQQKEVYFSDYRNVIWKLNEVSGSIEVVVGQFYPGGFAGEERDPLEARLNIVSGLHITEDNILYFVERNNHIVRKLANLCQDYSFSHSLVYENSSFVTARMIVQTSRTCRSAIGSDYFDAQYLPFVEVSFASGTSLQSFAMDWNQNFTISQYLPHQVLDVIRIQLNGCNNQNRNQFNCSFISTSKLATIPINSLQNFLFFPLFTTCTFINYYQTTSSWISLFQIELEFYNFNLNSTTKKTINNGLETVILNSLQHNSLYQVSIKVHVKYANHLEYIIYNQKNITTQLGFLPKNIIPTFSINNNVILIRWSEIPFEERGNVEITHIQIQYVKNQTVANAEEESNLFSISYNAQTNTPQFYSLTIDTNGVYSIQVRVCSEIGCTNFTEAYLATVTGIIDNNQFGNSNDIIIAVCVVLSIIFVIIMVIICIGIAFVLAMLIIVMKKQKKSIIVVQQQDSMIELVTKEFRIEEGKLDLSNSKVLGSGASGSVFTATYFNIPVAVKLIKSSNGSLMDDFYNELQFLHAHAQHNNIIRFFGVYENREKEYLGLVMEYCSNGTVANYVMKNSLDFAAKLSIIRGIAHGMQYLHHQEIAHRDLKCENILLDSTLTPKIIDFGFSKKMTEEQSQNMTMNIGTAAYCAPEVVQLQITWNLPLKTDNLQLPVEQQSFSSQHEINTGEATASNTTTNSTTQSAYDKKCDVYSFAIVMYVIYFQEKNPYGEYCSANQIMYQMAQNPNLRPNIDMTKIANEEMWLVELMRDCWKTNPQERPSFEQIVQRLNISNT